MVSFGRCRVTGLITYRLPDSPVFTRPRLKSDADLLPLVHHLA